MSVKKASSSTLNTMHISPGSLDEIGRVEVTGGEKVRSSILDLCSQDKAIAKKVFIGIFSKAVAKYGTGEVIPPAMQGIQREE